MTEAQWGRLFLALGQVPCIDAAMNLSAQEARILSELALKGLDWQMRGFLHYGDGDKLDALDLSARLGIDPASGEPKIVQSKAEQTEQLAQDWLDTFMDDLAHAGLFAPFI